jgi:hypothetical protein
MVYFRCNVVIISNNGSQIFNPLSPELNPICQLLALLAHDFLHVSRIRLKSLTLRLLMSYIYIYDISNLRVKLINFLYICIIYSDLLLFCWFTSFHIRIVLKKNLAVLPRNKCIILSGAVCVLTSGHLFGVYLTMLSISLKDSVMVSE